MHEIHPNLLWLGHALDIREPRALFDTQIAAIIDVALEEAPARLPRELIYCRFPLNDGGGNNPAVLRQAIQTSTDLLNSETRTIIACSAGMSRSPTIAACALANCLSQDPHDTVSRIGEIRTLELNPVLWKDALAALKSLSK